MGGSDEHQSLDSLPQLGSALAAARLESSAKVMIHWPVERCRLLGEEVVIIDSPGIDVEADLDNWIDKFCLDSACLCSGCQCGVHHHVDGEEVLSQSQRETFQSKSVHRAQQMGRLCW